jgi:putative transcriptional regulator
VNNRVRELRSERNWTQGKLAHELDVSRQTVNAIETGKYDPSLPLAFRIAWLFDLRIEDVFQPQALPPQDGHRPLAPAPPLSRQTHNREERES